VALAWGTRLSAVQQVVIWGVLLVAAAVLLRRGWLKLFGPVLFYDMVRSARRGRYIILRCLYAGLLLFFLLTVWLNTGSSAVRNDRREAARLAENFFETFMAVQLVAVILLTPAYVAGAIADEKERKTLDFLLATDLRNREIVLSKLVARLANLSLFILTGLPILSLIQFLGGVDPNLVLAGGAFTALTMAGLGALSILFSTYSRKPRDAIALTYLAMVAYLAISFLLLWWWYAYPGVMSWPLAWSSSAITVGDLVNAVNAGNLLIVMGKLADAGARGSLASDVPTLLWQYAAFHGTVFVGFTVWAVARLRALAVRQTQASSRRGFWLRRRRKRPAIFDPPMIWKEVFAEGGIRFNWLGRIVVLLVAVATLLPGVLLIVNNWDEFCLVLTREFDHRAYCPLRSSMNVYVRTAGTAVACLLLLGVAVRASTGIGGERDRQTLDALLISPLDSNAILFGKWLGAFLSVRWGWLWLGTIWAMGLLTGGMHLLALPALICAWAVYAAFLAAWGLWWSVTARTTLRATVWTLATTVALAVGHWLPWMCCVPMLGPFGRMELEALLRFQTGLTPPVALGIMEFHDADFRFDGANNEVTRLLTFIVAGLLAWLIATLFVGVSLGKRFRAKFKRRRYRYPGVKVSVGWDVAHKESDALN
jgi:ABC-type transport system involved in multi-copper enzyme maturation permease subunit